MYKPMCMNFEQAVFSGYYVVLPLGILQTTEILQTKKALTFSV